MFDLLFPAGPRIPSGSSVSLHQPLLDLRAWLAFRSWLVRSLFEGALLARAADVRLSIIRRREGASLSGMFAGSKEMDQAGYVQGWLRWTSVTARLFLGHDSRETELFPGGGQLWSEKKKETAHGELKRKLARVVSLCQPNVSPSSACAAHTWPQAA